MTRPVDWHPLRAADPVPGDAEAVRLLARRWSDTAEAMQTAARGLREVHDSTTAWRSAAGRAFAEQAGEVADRLDRVRRRYVAGADVLHGYARTLDDAQQQAGSALRRGQRAHDDLVAAERVGRAAATAAVLAAAATGAPVALDPAQVRAQARAADARSRLADAERDLQDAERLWRLSAVRTCDELDLLADDGLTDRLDGALDVVATATSGVTYVSAFLGLSGTAAAAAHPPAGLALGGAGLATGALAAAGTGVLWAADRASGRDVAWATVGPVAGGTARALRLLGELPDAARGRLLPRRGAPAGGSATPPAPAPRAPAGRSSAGTAARAPAAARAPGQVRSRRSVRAAEAVSTGSDVRTAAGGVSAATADDQPRR